MPEQKWTSSNVTVVPAPIAGQGRAAELLQQSYENSPSALIKIPTTKEDKDITYYNRIATGADAPKK